MYRSTSNTDILKMILPWCAAVILLCGLAFAQENEEDGDLIIPYREKLKGVQLTEKQKSNIVKLHNRFRGQQGASNMKEVRWDGDLEEYSIGTIYECEFTEGFADNWRVAPVYDQVNSFIMKYTSLIFNETIPIQTWFAERKNNIKGNACKKGTECRHYWRAAYAEVTRLGCAVNYCKSLVKENGQTESNVWLFACSYTDFRWDYFDHVWDDLYKVGPACSECNKDQFVCKQGVCAGKE